MGYVEDEWVHHSARMVRIRSAGLLDEYNSLFSKLYTERIPNPNEVGNYAECVISDEIAVEASGQVCYAHNFPQYDENDE